jgi:chromosome segregation ATPase
MTRTAVPLALAAGLLAGCGGVSELTKERVARSETSVQQAQQTVGNSEQGAVELQRAKENLDQARRALKDGKEPLAERHAQLAQLDAELAVSKSQSASARKAADEVLASIKQLRQEAERTSPTDPERTTLETSSCRAAWPHRQRRKSCSEQRSSQQSRSSGSSPRTSRLKGWSARSRVSRS